MSLPIFRLTMQMYGYFLNIEKRFGISFGMLYELQIVFIGNITGELDSGIGGG